LTARSENGEKDANKRCSKAEWLSGPSGIVCRDAIPRTISQKQIYVSLEPIDVWQNWI
jgi:hypothetical protein